MLRYLFLFRYRVILIIVFVETFFFFLICIGNIFEIFDLFSNIIVIHIYIHIYIHFNFMINLIRGLLTQWWIIAVKGRLTYFVLILVNLLWRTYHFFIDSTHFLNTTPIICRYIFFMLKIHQWLKHLKCLLWKIYILIEM